MIRHAPIISAIFLLALAGGGCDSDIGLSDFTYACESDHDCSNGNRCQPGVGCVRLTEVDDAGARADGGAKDAGADTCGDEDCTGSDGGLDAGRTDGGFVIRYSNTTNSAAGAGSSVRFQVKSATGWSTGSKRNAGVYQLKAGNPYGAEKK